MLLTEVGSPFEHEHPLMMVCSRGVITNWKCVTRGKDLILHKIWANGLQCVYHMIQ